ncbi:MAG: hypothetical protein AB7M05_20995 [Alphaproteobacteria bacterium]
MLNQDRLQEFYTAVGAAVWHLQFLEDVLVTYVAARLKLGGRGAGKVGLEVLDEQRQRTLGELVRDAKSGGILVGRIEEAFEVLAERNWLIHRSMHEVSDGLYNDSSREAAISRVRTLADKSISLKKALYADCRIWFDAQGVDVHGAEAAGLARFRELRDA